LLQNNTTKIKESNADSL